MIPLDTAYSPLWLVNAYPNTYFPMVNDLETVMQAETLGAGATTNCPDVFLKDAA